MTTDISPRVLMGASRADGETNWAYRRRIYGALCCFNVITQPDGHKEIIAGKVGEPYSHRFSGYPESRRARNGKH